MQHILKEKTINTIALDIDEFLRVCHSETAKEMWYTIKVTHDGNIEVKRVRMNTMEVKRLRNDK